MRLRAFSDGFFRGVEGALFLVWCLGWPVVVTLAATHGVVWLSAVGVALAGGTPLVLHAMDRRVLRNEKRKHRACHAQIKEMFDDARASHTFRLHEAVASELETLSDALRAVPPGASVDPGLVADTIDTRVRHLRSSSPDPPQVPLQDLLRVDADVPADNA
jgi:hypothetical protein